MYRKSGIVIVTLLASLQLQSCHKISDKVVVPACPSDEVDFATIFDTRYVQPFREGHAADWANVFADDAVALHNRRPADVGIEKIRAFGEFVANTFRLLQYDVELVDTRFGCDWAVSHGVFTSAFIFRETGEPAPWGPQSGKFMVVWEFNENNGWKIVADMGNTME